MRFEQIIEELRTTLAAIRTGQASTSLVENLEVKAYETTMKLKELAAITVPEARQIRITPWDKAVLEAIEKALREASFNPVVEDSTLRLVLSPLTGEDRERLMREVGERAEEAKIKLRGERREAIGEVERLEKEKQISEDEVFATKKEINEEVKEANRRITELAEEKKQQLSL